ncbi:hypothetical protein ACLM5J_10340 [Nocardioides sp. Bht2]|uniref:hypothetical protein n=1 Tax=Nocardioides sp. Bht2 TaxID=3392297 RepID=UPI0039B640F3
MAFSRENFHRLLKDIEERLGYLRGNENAWKYLREVQLYPIENPTEGGMLMVLRTEPDYKFPCPDPRFAVEPYPWWCDMYILPGVKFDQYEYMKMVQRHTDMAFEDGVAWARGIADYARSICDQFLAPDVPTMVDAILSLQRNVATPLVDAPNDDWANLGNLNARWTGDAAASFNEFYLNYNESLARSGLYTDMINIGFASAAKVISGTQFGAQFFLEDLRDALDAQLDQWVNWGRQPDDPPKTPVWVGDVGKIAEATLKLASHIPVVGEVTDKIDKAKEIGTDVKGLVTAIEDVSGKELLPKKREHTPVQYAESIYTDLTTTLTNDYLKAYDTALNSLQSGSTPGSVPDPGNLDEAAFSGNGVLDLMRADKKNNDWDLPEVRPESLRGNAQY